MNKILLFLILPSRILLLSHLNSIYLNINRLIRKKFFLIRIVLIKTFFISRDYE